VDFYTKKIGMMKPTALDFHDKGQAIRTYILIAIACVNALIFFANLKLLHFHIYLIKNNTTTYEYLVRKREKKRRSSVVKRKSSAMKIRVVPQENPNDQVIVSDGRNLLKESNQEGDQSPGKKKFNLSTKSSLHLKKITSRKTLSVSPSKVRMELEKSVEASPKNDIGVLIKISTVTFIDP
jgi:hypothetical protein